MKVFNRTQWLCGLVGLALILSACGGGAAPAGDNQATVSQSFAVDEDVTVTVSTYNGAIEIRTGSSDQVLVEVTKRGGGKTDAEAKRDLDNIQLALNQAAGSVKLVATHRGQAPADSAASFVVTVPAGAAVVASLTNGTIAVNGVKRDVTVTANNGDLTVRGVEEGAITARTTNGNVTLEGREVASLVASSSNGSVSFQGSVAESNAANRIDVGNGSISVTLPGDAQWGVDALTSNGVLTSDFTFQGNTTPTSVKGTVGASPTFGIVIRIKNGNITIKKQ
ncbi:MAG TPA: DUF4097 family beta strand repeat-containing protein [Anaerolineae bacterium]|nr:DUF4097 family beta strand repeat-containing protein [Anaerolineae bacterium]